MRRWWQCWLGLPPCLLQTVIVNLKDDPTTALQGVLYAVVGRWFVLRNASILKAGEPPVPADGELLIPEGNVAFLQTDIPPSR